MNLRDWLIVVGVVIIVGILVDGYRRMRLAKKDSLKMSIEMGGGIEESPLDEGFNPELPGGGARVVKEGTSVEPSPECDLPTEKLEPHFSADDTLDAPLEHLNEPVFSTSDATTVDNNVDGILVADSESRVEVQPPEANTDKSMEVAYAGKASTNKAENNVEPEQLVIVLNVHSKEGSFPGIEIKKLLEACGLDHGEMSIFHRHEEDDLLSPIQFSVANAVEPGYFNPDTLSEIATPGVSFFMSLPGPKDYMKAFDYMLETAQCFARNLKGDLKDQNRSMITAQTIGHCRQQIKDFERKQLSKSRV